MGFGCLKPAHRRPKPIPPLPPPKTPQRQCTISPCCSLASTCNHHFRWLLTFSEAAVRGQTGQEGCPKRPGPHAIGDVWQRHAAMRPETRGEHEGRYTAEADHPHGCAQGDSPTWVRRRRGASAHTQAIQDQGLLHRDPALVETLSAPRRGVGG